MPVPPPDHVLDLFAVPGPGEPVPGGQGGSVRAGDLVLSPGRDADVAAWLNPVLARLAVRLDEARARRPRGLRIAMPVPARDGSWVVDGWGASRFEPGTEACHDLDVTLAAGRLLHAELDVAVRARPAGLDLRDDRWARAERLAFGPVGTLVAAADEARTPLVLRLAEGLSPEPSGAEQLVHADLAGNLLLDPAGAPVVIDVAPAWRSVRWAEAVCVLDSVMWHDAPPEALGGWASGSDRQAMLRALAFRILADEPGTDPGPYEPVLELVVRPDNP